MIYNALNYDMIVTTLWYTYDLHLRLSNEAVSFAYELKQRPLKPFTDWPELSDTPPVSEHSAPVPENNAKSRPGKSSVDIAR